MFLGILIQLQVCLLGSWNVMASNEKYKVGFFAQSTHKYLKVQVTDEPQISGKILRLKTRILQTFDGKQSNSASGKLNIATFINAKEHPDISYGDQLIVPARYKEIQESLNPATFDYKSWLADQGIYHHAFFKQGEVTRLNRNNGNPLIKFAQQLRIKQLEYLKKHLKSTDATAFSGALILGYRADLDPELLTVYAKTGTIHALSVSGMHVGLIYLLLNSLLDLISKRRHFRAIKYVLIFTLVWFYTILTGLSPSVLRSAIMLSVFIIGKAFNKTSDNYNILAFTALLMLIVTPNMVMDIGFQLSFLAVLGLVSLNRGISGWWYFKNRLVRILWNAASISIAAQLATYPLSIYYFHQFPIYFLFANLIVMIPLSALMYLGIFILLFRVAFLMPLFEWLITLTNSTLSFIAGLPFSTMQGIWIDKTELLLLSLGLVMLIVALLHFNKKYLMIGVGLIALVATSSSYEDLNAMRQRKLVIYTIKGHHAIAFIEGRTAIMLTDLFRSDQIYKKQVLPYLEKNRVISIQFTTAQQHLKKGHFECSEENVRFFNYVIYKNDLIKPRPQYKKAIITNIE